MMTKDMQDAFSDFYGLTPACFKESFEGIGELDTFVFYLDELLDKVKLQKLTQQDFTYQERMSWKFKLTLDTFFDIFRIKKIEGSFKNVPG